MPLDPWSYPLIAAGATVGAGALATWLQAKQRLQTSTIWQHSINSNLCVGCGNCVDVCPRDVLNLIDYKSRVVKFDACIQCRECEAACPTQALRMHREGEKPAPLESPVLSDYYETSLPGLYLVGEAALAQFVKNAVNMGRAAVEHIIRMSGLTPLSSRPLPAGSAQTQDVDVLIVGAGPAGLSAALTCTQYPISFVVIERTDTAVNTVMSYPAGKSVHAMPPDVESVGLLPVRDFTKEELMVEWNQLTTAVIPHLLLQTGVEKVTRAEGGWFVVETDRKQRFRAQRVILAVGEGTLRGPDEKTPGKHLRHVRVGLDNPSRYRKQTALVLGGGNVAVEAAVQLADPKLENRVILAYRDKRHKMKASAKNREALSLMEAQQRVVVECQATVESFESDRTTLNRKSRGKKETVPTSAVFVCYGKEPGRKWLSQLGVAFQKVPHGEFSRPPTDQIVRRLLTQPLPAELAGASLPPQPDATVRASRDTVTVAIGSTTGSTIVMSESELQSALKQAGPKTNLQDNAPTLTMTMAPAPFTGSSEAETIRMVWHPMQRMDKVRVDPSRLSVAQMQQLRKGRPSR